MRSRLPLLLPLACLLMSAAFCAGAIRGDVIATVPTPDGQYLITLADYEFGGIYELYKSRPWMPPGSWNYRLSGASMATWDVWAFEVEPDSAHVRYEKGCMTCQDGHSYSRWWRVTIIGGETESLEIFRENFEDGSL